MAWPWPLSPFGKTAALSCHANGTAAPFPSNDHDQTRRERKLNWPCRELLMRWYSQLCPLSCSSFGDCRIGKPVGGRVELICDPPARVLPENHESATNPHGIFKFIGSER